MILSRRTLAAAHLAVALALILTACVTRADPVDPMTPPDLPTPATKAATCDDCAELPRSTLDVILTDQGQLLTFNGTLAAFLVTDKAVDFAAEDSATLPLAGHDVPPPIASALVGIDVHVQAPESLGFAGVCYVGAYDEVGGHAHVVVVCKG
jgi:hypothetical protein